MEQYHSEIKTDLCAEQFPSGKLRTNELVLELIQLAYNLLRMIGQASLRETDIPVKRPVNRRRIRTVIERIIMTPGVVTTHARQVRLDLRTEQSLAICNLTNRQYIPCRKIKEKYPKMIIVIRVFQNTLVQVRQF